jgi:hypothetical protein
MWKQKLKELVKLSLLQQGRQDIHHNDTHRNDNHHNDTQHKGRIWDARHNWHSAL